MGNKNKVRIPYLDINEHFYMENDELKMKVCEDIESKQGTWDDLWLGVIEIIEKVRNYDEKHNKDTNM